ncbi:MAG: CatA-like O-acetyltransferase [Lachnospiraceae bacterium]
MCKFEPVDIKNWPRAQAFHYYTQMAPTTYSVNVNMDVTILREELKNRNLRFFPAYLYLVTKAIRTLPELRTAVRDGVLGHWDSLTPAYPQFHRDDQTTSLLWTKYHDNFSIFYDRYIKDTTKHGESHGILSSKGLPLPNSYIISCIPWFSFNSFALHNHGIKDYYLPSLESGRFIKNPDNTVAMPLSITVHHATTDGFHLKQFFEELQHSMDVPLSWLPEESRISDWGK